MTVRTNGSDRGSLLFLATLGIFLAILAIVVPLTVVDRTSSPAVAEVRAAATEAIPTSDPAQPPDSTPTDDTDPRSPSSRG